MSHRSPFPQKGWALDGDGQNSGRVAPVLKDEAGRVTPTGFGLLLFGKEPRTVMPQAGLLGTVHFADGREETRDFSGPAVFGPEQAIQWLRDKLPNPIDRTRAQRREANEVLFELLREGIVDALVHRDYGIEGGEVSGYCSPGESRSNEPGHSGGADNDGAAPGLQRTDAEP